MLTNIQLGYVVLPLLLMTVSFVVVHNCSMRISIYRHGCWFLLTDICGVKRNKSIYYFLKMYWNFPWIFALTWPISKFNTWIQPVASFWTAAHAVLQDVVSHSEESSSCPLHMHEHIYAKWLILLWLIGERKYSTPPTLRAQPILLSWTTSQ